MIQTQITYFEESIKTLDNVGYAIKLSYLKNLLDSSNETISLNSTNTISSLPLTEKVKHISPCVLLVKANTQSTATNKKDIVQNNVVSEDEKRKARLLLESSQEKYVLQKHIHHPCA